VILVTGVTSAFANTHDRINERVTASFNRDFASAKNVSWQEETSYVKVTFSLSDNILFAYYTQDGDLMGVIRNMLSDRLPINLQAELKKSYSHFWINELFEMSTESQTTYYCSLESDTALVILQSDGSGHWIVYKKIRKNLA